MLHFPHSSIRVTFFRFGFYLPERVLFTVADSKGHVPGVKGTACYFQNESNISKLTCVLLAFKERKNENCTVALFRQCVSKNRACSYSMHANRRTCITN